jgi:hypothetical protein
MESAASWLLGEDGRRADGPMTPPTQAHTKRRRPLAQPTAARSHTPPPTWTCCSWAVLGGSRPPPKDKGRAVVARACATTSSEWVELGCEFSHRCPPSLSLQHKNALHSDGRLLGHRRGHLQGARPTRPSGRPVPPHHSSAAHGASNPVTRLVGVVFCQVFVTGRNEPSLQRVAAAVRESGGSSSFGIGDVSNESDVRRLFGEASAFFGAPPQQEACDLLITSAGIGRFARAQK